MSAPAPHVPLLDVAAALRGGDEEARVAAVRGMLPPPTDPTGIVLGLDLVLDAMGDTSFRVRRQAIEVALGWSDAKAVTERLVAAVAEPDNVGLRNAAAEGLTRLGKIALEPLKRALAGRPAHRKVLVDVLGALRDDQAAPALMASLSDEDANVRASACEGLGGLSRSDVVPALVETLGHDPDPLVKLAALLGLCRHRTALPLSVVMPFLDHPVLRPSVFLALGHSRDLAALPILTEGLLDRGRGTREAAMAGLAALHEGLPGAAAKREVGRALAELPELSVRSTIRALLEAAPEARCAAALVLGLSGREEAHRPLILALIDERTEVARAAQRGLLAAGPRAVESICALLPEMDERGRAALLGCLGAFGEEQPASLSAPLRVRVQALLCDGLSHASGEVQARAIAALSHLGDRDAIAPLAQVFHGAAEEATRSAVQAAIFSISSRCEAADPLAEPA